MSRTDRSDFEPVDGDGTRWKGAVVQEPVPDAAARMPYFLRFDIQSVKTPSSTTTCRSTLAQEHPRRAGRQKPGERR